MPASTIINVEPYALLYTRAGAGICLREKNTGKVGVIFIDIPDGIKLERIYHGERTSRPDTATLLTQLIDAMDGTVRMVLIKERHGEIFHSRITLDIHNEVSTKLIELDARPSDALMIAAHFQLPIKILPNVWNDMEDILPQLKKLDSDSTDGRAPIYLTNS